MVQYALDLDYTPPAPEPAPLEGILAAVATIDLLATADLDRFNLDLQGLTATSVEARSLTNWRTSGWATT